MKKSLILAALILAAALGFSAGRFSLQPRSGFDPTRDLQADRLGALLGLSTAQAAELETIAATYGQQVTQACDEHCAARCQLARALRQDMLSREDARALVEKMCASQQKNEQATLDHILRVREILTPDQRAKFSELIGACLCEVCGAGDASCCPTETNQPAKE